MTTVEQTKRRRDTLSHLASQPHFCGHESAGHPGQPLMGLREGPKAAEGHAELSGILQLECAIQSGIWDAGMGLAMK